MIDNLISNALKFTPAGGTVDVRAYPHGSVARIEVADTGMGISEDEQTQLFERFFRTARAQEEAIPGVGLGLSISKAIVEGHNGRISVRSVEGVGTTFFVDLPAIAKRHADRSRRLMRLRSGAELRVTGPLAAQLAVVGVNGGQASRGRGNLERVDRVARATARTAASRN